MNRRAYMKEWRKNNQDKVKRQRETWNAKHPEKIQAKRQRYHARHRERRLRYFNTYYLSNTWRWAGYRCKYAAGHPEMSLFDAGIIELNDDTVADSQLSPLDQLMMKEEILTDAA